MQRLVAKNWGDFQHYKDRSPAWIKLHKKLLDDYEYQCLPLASKALAPMFWLLASESVDGCIEWDVRKVAFRLRVTESDVMDAVKPLIANGFFGLEGDAEQDASAVLAQCLPREEKEKEKEKRESKRKNIAPSDDDAILFPNVSESVIRDFKKMRKAKKAEITETAMNGISKEAEKAGITLEAALEICCTRGWQAFKAEWMKPQAVTQQQRPQSRHSGFDKLDYSKDSDDGRI